MHLTRSHSEIVEDILRMGEVGYNVSERDSLPLLFFEVYSIELKKGCEQCKKSAYESLLKWAKRKSQKQNSYMNFTIKKEFEKKDFHFRHAGNLVVVNAANLNEERARMMLASKYAHAIEGQPDSPSVNDFSGSVEGIVKNESVVTASTSTKADKDGKSLVVSHKGKLAKSNELPQSKGKAGRPAKKVV